MKFAFCKRTVISLTLCLFIVFMFFFRTAFYSLKSYDELMPFNEQYLPVCFSLSEMVELISLLGLNNYFEASNTLYSNIISLRCNPMGNLLQLLIQLVFRKNAPDIQISYTPIPKSAFYDDYGIYAQTAVGKWKRANITQIRGILHEYLALIYYYFKGYL